MRQEYRSLEDEEKREMRSQTLSSVITAKIAIITPQ